METPSGWISYTNGPGGMDHLPPEVRAESDRGQIAAAVARAGEQLGRWR
jgi:hypothetical protein